MKVTQEKLPASQIGLEIEISAEMSKKTYEKVIQELARSANIPGFRKGKVPRPILLQRLGQTRVKATALEELIQKSLQDALEQESIQAIAQFELRDSFEELVSKFQPGEPLTFSAAVDVNPEVKLGDYHNLKVKAEEVLYDPSTADNFLEERRVDQATLIPVEGRAAQPGDVAVVDYSGRFASATQEDEGEEIQGARGTDFQVELAQERFIQEFVDGIVGMSPGETKQVPVNFPEDYGREDLAGRSAVFTITLKELKGKELPPLDDDFAQEVSEFETLSELRESLESRFKKKAEQETTTNKEQAVLEELLKHVEIALPESMISREVETVVTQTVMRMEQMGMDVKSMLTDETIAELRSRSRPEAINRLKQSLALEEIAERESLVVEPEALTDRIKEVREQLAGREIDADRLQEYVKSDLLKEKTIEWLIEHAAIELVPKGSLGAQEEQPVETESIASDTQEQSVETESIASDTQEQSVETESIASGTQEETRESAPSAAPNTPEIEP